MSACYDKEKGFRFLGESDRIVDVKGDVVIIESVPKITNPFDGLKKDLAKAQDLHSKLRQALAYLEKLVNKK